MTSRGFEKASSKSCSYSSSEELYTIVNSYISRKAAEELDLIENRGGDIYLEKGLQTNFKQGITSNSLSRRITVFGDNVRHAKLAKGLAYFGVTQLLTPIFNIIGLFSHIKEACEDLLIRILIMVCIGMLVVHLIFDRENFDSALLDSVSIIVAVVLCVSVGSFNNYQKEKQYLALFKVSENNKYVLVQRDGALTTLHSNELVVGDVVMINEGMEIPADGWVIQSHDIRADESLITGENDSISKEAFEKALQLRSEAKLGDQAASFREVPSPVVLAGSKILSGSGKFVVLQVGKNSSVGRMGDLILGENDPTPLQEKLNDVAESIVTYGTFAAVSIVAILLAKFAWTRYLEGSFDLAIHQSELVSYLIIGLSTAVASIPEGLPLAVTIALAYSAKKMLKDSNLVRKLEACETMGGADAICSDKTGTLTQNKMTVDCMYLPSLYSNLPMNVKNTNIQTLFPQKLGTFLTVNFACNNNSNLEPQSGSKTNIALLELLRDKKVDFAELRRKYINDDTKVFDFSSIRKRSGIIVEIGGRILLEKGAAELILASCSHMHLSSGAIVEIGEPQRERLNQIIESMSSKALRILAFAYKPVVTGADLESKDHHNVHLIEKSRLILTGFVGIKDPLRDGVEETIRRCKKAGIKVRMITGDNKLTAKEIARECGILDSKSIVMEGEEFMESIGGIICKSCRTAVCDCPRSKSIAEEQNRNLRVDTIAYPAEFNRIYKNLDVLARARPQDKYALVVGLKERGYVVAVTGDGANDAPALLKADVGFAMGISGSPCSILDVLTNILLFLSSGTEIAKESSDIVIMDDNFGSIVKSVVWGRNVYDNIQKFLQFQLTINVSAVLLIMIGSTILSSPVFTAVQLLWINLVMDTLASLALAAEDPDDSVLNRLPQKRTDKIISSVNMSFQNNPHFAYNKTMTKHILGQSFYQLTVLCFIIFYGDKFIPENLPDVKDISGNSIIYNNGTQFIRSGRIKYPFSVKDDYHPLEIKYGPSRHFTIVFNTFVFLQVFGFFAARKIDDSFNIFKGVSKSYLFLLIIVFVSVVQTLFVEYGGKALACSADGLSQTQWLICLGFAAGGLVVNFLLKLIPDCGFSLQLENSKDDAETDAESTPLKDRTPFRYESDL